MKQPTKEGTDAFAYAKQELIDMLRENAGEEKKLTEVFLGISEEGNEETLEEFTNKMRQSSEDLMQKPQFSEVVINILERTENLAEFSGIFIGLIVVLKQTMELTQKFQKFSGGGLQ